MCAYVCMCVCMGMGVCVHGCGHVRPHCVHSYPAQFSWAQFNVHRQTQNASHVSSCSLIYQLLWNKLTSATAEPMVSDNDGVHRAVVSTEHHCVSLH